MAWATKIGQPASARGSRSPGIVAARGDAMPDALDRQAFGIYLRASTTVASRPCAPVRMSSSFDGCENTVSAMTAGPSR